MDFYAVTTSQLADADRDAILTLKMQHWVYPMASQRAWWAEAVAADDRHLMLRETGTLVAYLRMVARTDEGTSALAVAGVGTVCVDRARRGGGIGLALMRHANRLIQESATPAIGLLRCDDALSRFYGRCGWRRLDHEVWMRTGAGAPVRFAGPDFAMAYDPGGFCRSALTIAGPAF